MRVLKVGSADIGDWYSVCSICGATLVGDAGDVDFYDKGCAAVDYVPNINCKLCDNSVWFYNENTTTGASIRDSV